MIDKLQMYQSQTQMKTKSTAPGNSIDIGGYFIGTVGSRERPADIASGVTNMGTDRKVATFLVINQGFDDNRYNCRQYEIKFI